MQQIQVSVEAVNDITKCLTIEVPAEMVQNAYVQCVKQLAKTEKMKGYRPGRVPMHIIENKYSVALRENALKDIIQSAFATAIKQENLQPVTIPKFQPQAFAANAPLKFTATFEVLPTVDSVSATLENIKKPLVEVTDADIDIVVEHLQKQQEAKEIDEAFVKKMGVASGEIADLRAEIKTNLEREAQNRTKAHVKDQVFKQLISQNPLHISKSLIEAEAQRLHQNLHNYHGTKCEHKPGEVVGGLAQLAEQNIALGILISKLAEQHQITVNKQQTEDYIKDVASLYTNPAQIFEFYTKDHRALAEISMRILEDQVVEKLLLGVTIEEYPLGYQELINEQQGK